MTERQVGKQQGTAARPERTALTGIREDRVLEHGPVGHPARSARSSQEEDHTASLIDRAPWARVDDMKNPVHIEDLVLPNATRERVPVYVPNRGSGRAGRHMWVPADDCELWRELLVGEKASLPVVPEQEEDDQITFAEQEIDRTCRAGEEGWFVSDARPIRDLGQPTGGYTLPWMPLQRSVKPSLITSVERAAASAALGCPPWELGVCAGCGQSMRRHGRHAAMYCAGCRAELNGR